MKQASEVRAMDRFTADRCSFSAKFMNESVARRAGEVDGEEARDESAGGEEVLQTDSAAALPLAFETLGLAGKKPQQSHGRGSDGGEDDGDAAANHRVQSKGKRNKRRAQKSAEETSGARGQGHEGSAEETQHIAHVTQELSGTKPSQGARESDQDDSGEDMIANRSSKGKRNKHRTQRSLGTRGVTPPRGSSSGGSDDAAGEH